MKIKQWRGEHVVFPEVRESDHFGLNLLSILMKMNPLQYRTWMYYDDYDIPIAFGGIVVEEPKTGTAFTFLSESIKEKPVAFTLACRRKMIQGARELFLDNLYAYVDTRHPERCGWIERLGFERDDSMTQEYNNIEMWVYRWAHLHQYSWHSPQQAQ